jgi:IclR family transcriptional regulator, pca regulon regulatory protein
VAPKARSSRPAQTAGDKPNAPDDSRNVVNSIAKGFRVLEAFSADRPEFTLTEVAALAKLDPGTAFRMLNTLVMLGYLHRIPDTRRFRVFFE